MRAPVCARMRLSKRVCVCAHVCVHVCVTVKLIFPNNTPLPMSCAWSWRNAEHMVGDGSLGSPGNPGSDFPYQVAAAVNQSFSAMLLSGASVQYVQEVHKMSNEPRNCQLSSSC